ncbi:MAG: hypothetical protein IPM69_18145 [Ignavibacteria bacterium]|nr:hypothetical protein [Ignavibacteria bacterium]
MISPILANIYLHYVLDIWFEKGLKKELQGYASIVRYADDFIILVERESDCTLILEALRLRLAKFKLELSETKTSLVKFGRNTDTSDENKHPGTFDFLGLPITAVKPEQANSRYVGGQVSPASALASVR